ncbi:hypothetical protein FRB93_010618 [Tulasnella sp. JGI-2019a]|nr:hypothetical protein FRB93_010618 [Tulasnella sp. JGI-2019a]
MSPKLFNEIPKTMESDTSALGLMIGEVPVGISPFTGLSHGPLIRAIMFKQRPPFTTPLLYRPDNIERLPCLAFFCPREVPTLRRRAKDIIDEALPATTDMSVLGPRLSTTEIVALEVELDLLPRQPLQPQHGVEHLLEEATEHHGSQLDDRAK